MGITVRVSADMRGVSAKVARIKASEPFGMFLANEAMKGMDPYVPFRDGILAKSAKAQPFAVTYSTPYARAVYYGTDKSFSPERHPLATAKWDEAYALAHVGELAQAGTDYIRSGGRL